MEKLNSQVEEMELTDAPMISLHERSIATSNK